mgnify:CR=1 FL=1
MLTNILKVIIIYFAFFSCSLGTEYFSIKFQKLKINSITEGQFNKIGTIRGKAREYPYGFNYYANVKEGNLQELIETFYFENYGDYVGRFSAWARNTVYTSNSKNGCNNSKDKIYHAVVDNGVFHFNCFSVKIVSGINEIWGPNFNSVNYVPMGQRKSTLKKFLKSYNNLKMGIICGKPKTDAKNGDRPNTTRKPVAVLDMPTSKPYISQAPVPEALI